MILATAKSSLLLLYAQPMRSSCANIARSLPSIAWGSVHGSDAKELSQVIAVPSIVR